MKFRIFLMLLLGESIHPNYAMENSASAQSSMLLTKQLNNHGLHLKITQPPCLADCRFVAENLHQVNHEKMGEFSITILKLPFSNKPVGKMYQHFLEIVDTEILEEILGNMDSDAALQKTIDLVNSLLKKAHEHGVKRVFSSCRSESKLVQFFLDSGFRVSTELLNLEKNGKSIYFYKNIDSMVPSIKNDMEIIVQNESIITEGYSGRVEFEEFMVEVPKIPNLYAIFLHDNQKIRGGVFGGMFTSEDESYEGVPHSHINILWVDKSLNGRGLGTILMREAEDFAIKKGAKYLQLDTNGFQAPGFYQKLGFSLSEIRPNNFMIDGKPSSLYVCTKKLFENPLQDQSLKPYFNILFGSQFFLRPLFPEDYMAFLPVFMDEDQMKYLGSGKPLRIEKAKEYIENGVRENNKIKPSYFSWAIITHEGIAGRVFLTNMSEESLEKELGYFVCPAFGGRGLATEASRLAMSSMESPFMATVHPENIGSRIVLTKLGFRADESRIGVFISKYGNIRDFYILQNKPVDTSGSLGDVLKSLVTNYE